MIESADEHTGWSVGITEKGHPLRFYGCASIPPGEAGNGMMASTGLPPAEAGEMRIFEDNIIWYRLPLQNAGIAEKMVAAGSSSK